MIEISCQDNLYGKNKIAVQHEEDTLTQKSRIRGLYTHTGSQSMNLKRK